VWSSVRWVLGRAATHGRGEFGGQGSQGKASRTLDSQGRPVSRVMADSQASRLAPDAACAQMGRAVSWRPDQTDGLICCGLRSAVFDDDVPPCDASRSCLPRPTCEEIGSVQSAARSSQQPRTPLSHSHSIHTRRDMARMAPAARYNPCSQPSSGHLIHD